MTHGREAAPHATLWPLTARQQRTRITAATVVVTACWVVYIRSVSTDTNTDLWSIVLGAQAWLRGQDPYLAVAQSPVWTAGLLYPFTAVLALAPFAWLPQPVMHVLWAAGSAGLLAWMISADGFTPRHILLVSPAMLHSVNTAQWPPLLLAASLTTWGGFLFACKPTTSLWLFAYRPRWQHVAGSVALLAVSLAVWPSWPAHWRVELARGVQIVWPLSLPGAAIVLLALLRWRNAKARLLVTMACVPHSTLVYETLPLFMIPRTWIEAGVLWCGSLLAVTIINAQGPFANGTEWARASGRLIVWFVYLPALVMVLRPPARPIRLTTRAFEHDSR
jgi:hypothetical protein